MTDSDRPAAPPADRQWMPVPQVIALAEQHQAAGRLGEAEHLLRQVLQARPKNAEALHLLGVVAYQSGQAETAIDLIRRAVAVNGNVPLYHANLGEMSRLAGRVNDAIASGKRALALQPNYPQALSNLGIAYYDKGDYDAAVDCQRRALALDPRFAEAYSNLGNALRAQKKLDEAIAALEQALKLKPGFADFYNNIGTALRDLKRLPEAEAAYLKAFSLRPHDVTTLNNLSLVATDLKRHEEALSYLTRSMQIDRNNHKTWTYLSSCFLDLQRTEDAVAAAERAYALGPADPDTLNMMGRVSFERNQPEQAAAFYRRAIAGRPDFVDAHNNLGNALKELGRFDEAIAAYQQGLALDPRATAVYVNLADARKFTADDPVLAAMEDLAGEIEGFTEDEQMQLHFALGKAHGDLAQRERAFHHLLRGNALKRRQIEYDESAMFAVFDRIREIFSPALMRAKAGAGDPTPVPIFILGMPRSGTTLIEQILASHPLVFGGGELSDFTRIVESVRGPDGNLLPYPDFVPALGPEHLRRIGTDYLRRIRGHDAASARITDKMPGNYLHVGLIRLALPNARIIHSMRNPVDTCLSCFSKLFSGEQHQTYDLGELGRYYRKYEELMAHWRAILPEGAMLDVRYEEVVADLEAEARRIIAFCGLDWDDACLAFHETQRPIRTASATQVRQPIYRSSVGRWLPYKDLLAPLLQGLEIDPTA